MKKTINKMLGQELKQIRIDSHLSQQDIADALHIARSTITGYESGYREIPIDIFVKFCDLCHKNAYDILEKVGKYAYK